MNYPEALEHSAAVKRSQKSKPVLSHIQIEEAENGGHSVEHRFENNGPGYHEPKTFVFGKPEGAKPQLPKGHVLQHVAEHMGIPHEVMGKESGAQSEEPEKEEDED
jgi:hypothetical protein